MPMKVRDDDNDNDADVLSTYSIKADKWQKVMKIKL